MFSGREPQNSLLHGAKPCLRLFPPVRNRVGTVRETLLGLSAQRDTKSLLALSLSTFGHVGCFDTCNRSAGLQRTTPLSLTKFCGRRFVAMWRVEVVAMVSFRAEGEGRAWAIAVGRGLV